MNSEEDHLNGPPRASEHCLCSAPLSRLPLAVRRLDEEVGARFTMHIVLTVLDQPPSDTARWWAIDLAEHGRETTCGLPPLHMKSYTTWPRGITSPGFASDTPLHQGARATRMVTTVDDLVGPLSAVVYPASTRWHQVLPVSLRRGLHR